MAKILYVEDEPFLGKIVKESLESRDFIVNMIADGAKVMASFENFTPDICVLDVMLPHVDGFALAATIRRDYPTLPIIFLTAKDQTTDVLKGFEMGGNDYIRKPFSLEELIVRIENLLKMAQSQHSKTATAPHSFYTIGIYQFHPEQFELSKGTTTRRLSHRETELLKVLCENAHKTVQRKDILLKIWGDDSFFNSRNLDVYVTKLRDYLREDPSVEIMTVKGVGYLFRC